MLRVKRAVYSTGRQDEAPIGSADEMQQFEAVSENSCLNTPWHEVTTEGRQRDRVHDLVYKMKQTIDVQRVFDNYQVWWWTER